MTLSLVPMPGGRHNIEIRPADAYIVMSHLTLPIMVRASAHVSIDWPFAEA